ncbi:MAG: molybdopterin molybdenumtransferase MoeA [Solirubrobacterales bacterium]|nr:MAG: molybdopterin molybdenumtransferase MoeA [Solirubrobacterales bacterium]
MAEHAPQPHLLSIDDALALVAAHVTPLPAEEVALAQAYGRFIAEDLRAAVDLPPFASSAMDGYALRGADTPGRLEVVGESAAGTPYRGELGPGQAVAISTGAVVPAQADAVVPVEDVEVHDDGARIELSSPVEPGAFVRAQGGDIERGARLLEAGTRLGPAQIGAAAAVGLGTLKCRRRPRVAVLATGSELRQPGGQLAEGEIYDANGPMLRAAMVSSGARVELVPSAADTHEAHRAALARALEHDVVLSSGGVSVGAHDLVRSVGAELGVEEVFWRVALRPGKPLAFGTRGPTLVFGLPGNPVSSLVNFELFVRPALLALQGAPSIQPDWSSGTLAAAVPRNASRDELIRVRASATGAGTPAGMAVLSPLPGQQSHQIAIAAQADGLALIPTGTGDLPADAQVAYLPLQRS